jgi:hypothetical protein
MGWGDLWQSFGGTGGTPGTSVGGSGPGWQGQQQLLDAAPAGAMGPMMPQKNVGLGLQDGSTPDPAKAPGGLGQWWRESGGGNLKGPAAGGLMAPGGAGIKALEGVQQFAQRQQQQAPVQAMAAPQVSINRGGGGGGGGLLSTQPQQAPLSGNPYLEASPQARRAIQLQRGLLT